MFQNNCIRYIFFAVINILFTAAQDCGGICSNCDGIGIPTYITNDIVIFDGSNWYIIKYKYNDITFYTRSTIQGTWKNDKVSDPLIPFEWKNYGQEYWTEMNDIIYLVFPETIESNTTYQTLITETYLYKFNLQTESFEPLDNYDYKISINIKPWENLPYQPPCLCNNGSHLFVVSNGEIIIYDPINDVYIHNQQQLITFYNYGYGSCSIIIDTQIMYIFGGLVSPGHYFDAIWEC